MRFPQAYLFVFTAFLIPRSLSTHHERRQDRLTDVVSHDETGNITLSFGNFVPEYENPTTVNDIIVTEPSNMSTASGNINPPGQPATEEECHSYLIMTVTCPYDVINTDISASHMPGHTQRHSGDEHLDNVDRINFTRPDLIVDDGHIQALRAEEMKPLV